MMVVHADCFISNTDLSISIYDMYLWLQQSNIYFVIS